MGQRSWGATSSLLAFLFIPLMLGCGASPTSKKGSSDSSGSIPTMNASEASYCNTVTSYTSVINVTITGRATFQRREVTFSGAGGLGAAGTARPIRFAEVRVTNAAGTLIQCATTNEGGTYQFVVPQTSVPNTVSVTSRAANSQLHAYVYDDPRYNNYYSITTSFSPIASQSLATINASATDSSVTGGAFNILDQFYEANEFLRNEATCTSTTGNYLGCQDFSAITVPRVTAYWKAGFNPAEYYGIYSSGISFYLPGYDRLFILGGIQGDINNTDTDHFDDSVILHEYGHFLEDNLFISDSQGGPHSIGQIIDPRLAWSEGWGNFFQAAVRNDQQYIDTLGNIDGDQGAASTQFAVYFDIEDHNSIGAPSSVGALFGEGTFNEVAVTRFLWDVFDGTAMESGDNDDINNAFADLWWSLRSDISVTNGVGWRRPASAFRQIGHLFDFQSLLGTSAWTNLHPMHTMRGDTSDYAQYVATSGGCTYSITPYSTDGDHPVANMDFYHLKRSATQSITLTLNYSDANLSGTLADLDLYIYNEDANGSMTPVIPSDDQLGRSELSPTGGVTVAQTESITRTLSSGNYLIVVNAYNGIGGATNYTLTLNGSQLCPAELP